MPRFVQQIKTLKKLLQASPSILLAVPLNADADSFGSLLAFYWGISQYLKNKKIFFYPSLLPFYLNFLPGAEKIQDSKIYDNNGLPTQPSLIITFDTGDLKRIPIINELENKKSVPKIINIDHHKNGFSVKHLNIINPSCPATTQIIFEIFQKLNWEINKKIAICLLAGLVYDTASFQHSNTTAKTLKVAGELMSRGASLYKITQNILNYKIPTSYLKAWGGLLGKAKRRKNGLIVSALLQKEVKKFKASRAEFSPVASLLNMVPKSKYSLVLIEKNKGEVKGSLRTEKSKGIDVAKIAQSLGGGGHKLAAGFTINGKLVETAKGWKIIKNNNKAK